ncbi:MAG: sigma factor G inhibitor Gin [Bacillus sp. (in: firmicutes)]
MEKSTEQSVQPICIVCNHHKEEGILLYQSFICCECEKGMIKTDTTDPKYHYYVQKLKKVNKPEIFN